MKQYILFVLIILAIFISGCTQSTSSGQLIGCNPERDSYILNDTVNRDILTDEEAFEALKQFWNVYDTQDGTYWVEDAIRSDMTVAEALDNGILKSGIDIRLTSGELVQDTWMLYNLKAVDKKGNIYFCEHLR